MTGARLRIGFALGAALAGMLAAALRVTGVSEQATAVADDVEVPAAARAAPVASPPAVASPPPVAAPAEAPVAPAVAERWRTKPAAPAEVTARVVSRAARVPAPERAPAARCAMPEAAAVRAKDDAPARAKDDAKDAASSPCDAKAETVEIDWHAPAPTP